LKPHVCLPLVGDHLKHDFKVLNKTDLTGMQANQNQNLPKMENQKTGTSVGLPLVGKDRLADTAAVSLKPHVRLPLVGQGDHLKHNFKVLNKTNLTGMQANQNLPKMENQKPGASTGLPLVGTASSDTQRKEPGSTVPPLTRFHDHSVLESKPHFMIIFRLENAAPRLVS